MLAVVGPAAAAAPESASVAMATAAAEAAEAKAGSLVRLPRRARQDSVRLPEGLMFCFCFCRQFGGEMSSVEPGFLLGSPSRSLSRRVTQLQTPNSILLLAQKERGEEREDRRHELNQYTIH